MLNTIHHDTCENFMSTMEDNSVDLVVTDPPYEFVVNNPNGAGFMKDRDYIKTINNTFGMTYNPDQYLNECKRILKKFNGYFWTNKNLLKNYIEFADQNKYSFDILLWSKPNPVPINNGHYLIDKEYIMFIREKGATFNSNLGYKTYFTIKDYPIGSKRTEHPTEKPLAMHMDMINISSNKGDIIFDGYSGTGTTALACLLTKRNYICVESDLRWVTESRGLLKSPSLQNRSNFKEDKSTNKLFN